VKICKYCRNDLYIQGHGIKFSSTKDKVEYGKQNWYSGNTGNIMIIIRVPKVFIVFF